ncbi:molybdopterin-dependent oxidoreductase [Paenibacillus alba]|uniref:molybdopterin-dependent oxidoreductase n=1 Tax=Paenibacillus alba TaxID=1197127 RepID=UPI001563E3AA|nr:molybdopterin-dependent oxidoreductase [Paenibacillus alba]NQX67932.1 molybdopterin-dependent oxidoreductase [Paenibacillus alba]
MSLETHIQVSDIHIATEEFTVAQMVELAEHKLSLEARVPEVQGKAFDLKDWYRSWKTSHAGKPLDEPTHVKVEAVDEFQALIPWSEAEKALFLYEQDGQPLKKGYPIRLYVPDGSSECLNVKSIVNIWFLHDPSLGEESTFGFKNRVTLDELKYKK